MVRYSYLVLGAGQQGVAAAYDLLVFGNASKVTLADAKTSSVEYALRSLKKLLKTTLRSRVLLDKKVVDCRNKKTLARLFKSHSAVLSALPYYLNPPLARAAIAAKIHYCDLGGYFDSTSKILEMDEAAKKAGVTLVPDCGVSPGLCNSLAAAGIARLDVTTDVHIYCGGLPTNPKPPLGYKAVFNLEGVLGNYFGSAYILKDREIQQVPSFSGLEKIDFGEPLGNLEAIITGGATSTCPWTYRGKILNYDYKTLRYPGHYEKIQMLKDLGLLETKPVNFKGRKIIPRKFFVRLAEPKLKFEEDQDLLVMRVIVLGFKNGQPSKIIYDLLEYGDPETGFTAMQRTTGFSAAIILEMLAQGKIPNSGVMGVERAVAGALFLEEIRRRGIRVRESISAERLAA